MSLPPPYDAIEVLGVYHQLPVDVKAQLLNLPDLPPSAKAKAEAAMAEKVADPETGKNLLDEVKALGDSAVKVDNAFERVRLGLGQVDANNYKDKDGRPIPKLQPTWADYQKVSFS
jgi:hypothetical protein